MPNYTIVHNKTGEKLTVSGPRPPTADQARLLFEKKAAETPPVKPQPQQPVEHDFNAVNMVKNIPESAVKYAGDLVQPILHPVETVKNLQTLGQGLVEKMLPTEINGVEFGETENEKAVDAVGGFIKDRYGSIDSAQKTLETDPVGALADVAGVLTLGAGAVPKVGKLGSVATKVQKAGAAIEPLNATVSALKASKATSLIPKSVPRRLMDSAFKFTEKDTTKRIKLVDIALEKSMVPTIKQLETNLQHLDDLGRKINARVKAATAAGNDVPANAVFLDLNAARAKFGGVQIHSTKNLSIIDGIAAEMMDSIKKHGKMVDGKLKITPEDLQRTKTNAYKDMTWDRINQSSSASKDAARGAIAKSSRKALEKIDPELAPLNREWGDLKTIEPQIEQAVNRFYNSDLLSLGGAAKIGASHVAGGPAGAAAGVTAAYIGKAPNKARLAIVIENLRRLSESKKLIENNMSKTAARAALVEITRAEEALKQMLPEDEDGSQ